MNAVQVLFPLYQEAREHSEELTNPKTREKSPGFIKMSENTVGIKKDTWRLRNLVSDIK